MVIVDLALGVPGNLPVGREDDGFGFGGRRGRQVHHVVGDNHFLGGGSERQRSLGRAVTSQINYSTSLFGASFFLQHERSSLAWSSVWRRQEDVNTESHTSAAKRIAYKWRPISPFPLLAPLKAPYSIICCRSWIHKQRQQFFEGAQCCCMLPPSGQQNTIKSIYYYYSRKGMSIVKWMSIASYSWWSLPHVRYSCNQTKSNHSFASWLKMWTESCQDSFLDSIQSHALQNLLILQVHTPILTSMTALNMLTSQTQV